MKTLRNSLLALLTLTLTSTGIAGTPAPIVTTPPPPQGGPYLTISGGALWLEDASAYGVSLDFDTGFSVLGALGYAFGNGLAVEIESGYTEVDGAELHYRGFYTDVDGEFRQVPILANVVYTADVTDHVSFYIGAGAGIIWSDAQVDSIGGLELGRFGDVEDEWNFAAQAKAGVAFKLSEATSFNVGYRFLYGQDAIGGADDSLGHILEGGLTFRF